MKWKPTKKWKISNVGFVVLMNVSLNIFIDDLIRLNQIKQELQTHYHKISFSFWYEKFITTFLKWVNYYEIVNLYLVVFFFILAERRTCIWSEIKISDVPNKTCNS